MEPRKAATSAAAVAARAMAATAPGTKATARVPATATVRGTATARGRGRTEPELGNLAGRAIETSLPILASGRTSMCMRMRAIFAFALSTALGLCGAAHAAEWNVAKVSGHVAIQAGPVQGVS